MKFLFWRSCLTVLMVLVVTGGCGKPGPQTKPVTPVAKGHVVMTVHWLGTKAIVADTNAINLQLIANLPESQRLRAQTLDKLARAPWTLQGLTADTNAGGLLLPLLEDILSHECLFDLVAYSNGPPAWILASRLDTSRFSLWETNLATVLESLTGKKTSPMPEERPGWLLANSEFTEGTRTTNRQSCFCFTRSRGWTLLGTASNLATFDAFSEEMLDQRTRRSSTSNNWMEATVDWARLAGLGCLPTNWFPAYPTMDLNLSGSEGEVRTEASFRFPESIGLELAPWNVPTNLVQPPLSSFTAVRSLDCVLPKSAPWQRLGFGQTPDQLFVWGYAGQPMFTFFAAHVANPKDFTAHASALVLPDGQPWLDEERKAGFKPSPQHDGFEWQGVPYLSPFLMSVTADEQSYVMGGSFIHAPVTAPLQTEFYEKALSPTNIIYYSWEQTGPRLGQWLFIGQFIRFASGKPQLASNSAAVGWIEAARTILGDSVTRIHQESPNRLLLTRSSPVGLTAIELHALIDWLESPGFPRGLYTFTGPAPSSR
jgi:hypothetical protein